MEIRKLTENDREACQKISRYAFETSKNTYEDLRYPNEKTPMDWYYGAFEEDKLFACVGVIPFDIRLRSQDFKMGGVMGVATKPEFRNRGIIRDIMISWFKSMYDNSVPLSVLYPFKLSFYEKLGYRLVDEHVFYQFKIIDIIYKETDYSMKEVERINDDIQQVYDKVTKNYDYIAKRPSIGYWRGYFKDNYKFICYNKDEPVGYIIITFAKRSLKGSGRLRSPEKTIVIREVFWLDKTAKQTIFNFLWSHRDQRKYIAGRFSTNEIITDLLKTPRIKERTIMGNSLLRIVDVKTVLENLKYPFDNFSLAIQIHDEFCPWNNGVFVLNSIERDLKVEFLESSIPVDIEVDISYFSQLIAGFRTINDLMDLNFISIKKEKLKVLQELFSKTNNFLYDFF